MLRRSFAVSDFEVIIVGAGPAGLSAALTLGRCRRSTLVIDHGKPRNQASRELHGFLTRDGISPQEFLAIGRAELSKYPSVYFFSAEVTQVNRVPEGFNLQAADRNFTARMLLLATGILDVLPAISGLEAFWGVSIFQCPYCDGWEARDSAVGIYAKKNEGIKLSLALRSWTHHLILLTDGPSDLTVEEREVLSKNNIQVNESKLARLEGEQGQLSHVVFTSGKTLPLRYLFLHSKSYLRTPLLDQLGCKYSHEEGVQREKYDFTEIPGLYVAGDICREVQLAIVAAAEGAKAAFGINVALTAEDTL